MARFPRDKIGDLLVECHRRCCICHRFCGVKIETDHIVPAADGGTDDVENAIPVCFECHADIHSYNDRHPRGRKFLPQELRGHKQQWLRICRENPEALLKAQRSSDVGPLQALIDELEFNARVSRRDNPRNPVCPFRTRQLERAIQEGAIASLSEDLRDSILDAYKFIDTANHAVSGVPHQAAGGAPYYQVLSFAHGRIEAAGPKIALALHTLLRYLGSSDEDTGETP